MGFRIYFQADFFSVQSYYPNPGDPKVNEILTTVQAPITFAVTFIPIGCYLTVWGRVRWNTGWLFTQTAFAFTVQIFFMLLYAYTRMQHLTDEMRKKRRHELLNTLAFAVAFLPYFFIYLSLAKQSSLPQEYPHYWFSIQVYLTLIGCNASAVTQATLNTTVSVSRWCWTVVICGHIAIFRSGAR